VGTCTLPESGKVSPLLPHGVQAGEGCASTSMQPTALAHQTPHDTIFYAALAVYSIHPWADDV
jgi:hypothetical protein